MFINVTAKAQKIFRKYPTVKDQDKAKKEALANPIYSWHASYFTTQRHKMLCFMNDASHFCIMLPNITAADYGHLQEKFDHQLSLLLRRSGVDQKQIDHYLKEAGAWEINKTVNRQLLGRLTQTIREAKYMMGGSSRQTLANLANLLKRADKSANYFASPELFEKANEWKQPEADKKMSKKAHLHLQNSIQQLRYITSHSDQILDDKKFDAELEHLQKLNEQLINDFINDKQNEVSKKTLNRYRDRLLFFLNEFLAPRMVTIFDEAACDLEEPLYHGFSLNEMKQTRASLKKLYQFLLDQHQISKEEFSQFKKILNQQFKNSDADFMDVPENLDELLALSSTLPISRETEELLKQYCTAAVNLYGLISCDQLYRIMVKQNPKMDLDPEQIVDWFEQQRNKHRDDFVISQVAQIPSVINPKIYNQRIEDNLLAQQINLPFYQPSRSEFLNYQEPGYLEETASVKKFRQFMIKKLGVPRLQTEHWLKKVRSLCNEHFIQSPGQNLHDLNEEMVNAGYGCSSKAEVQELVDDFMSVYQETRLFINRGLKPVEARNETSVVSLLKKKHRLTQPLINDLKNNRRDPMDVLLTVMGLNEFTDKERDEIADQLAMLPIPSLD